ncbi:MAG: mechanosensitive ion channel [Gammaproteobacteria bacterium]|nr:mechanosensitive ion channel [Gammaproteobacteria bacterium]
MDKIRDALNQVAFSVSGNEVSVWQLLLIPVILVTGFLLGRWLIALVTRKLVKRGFSPDLVHLIKRLFYVLILAVLLITTLDLINVPITAFAFVSGAVAIGVGFGAQNIINNFISGWILMWERPIRIGDFLEIGEAKGTVEEINTRSTRIRRVDGVHMLIPNSALLENTVVNWTLIDRLTRTSVRVGIAYGSPVRRAHELILQATREQEGVLSDPAPSVIFDDFGDNALAFEAFFWIYATVDRDLRTIRSNIRFRITELFEENDIVIAFPQRDVHIDGAITVMQKSALDS